MLADIIIQHPRGKMTLQEVYILLKERYGDHFSDDGPEDTKGNNSGGWRVFLAPFGTQEVDRRIRCDMRCR